MGNNKRNTLRKAVISNMEEMLDLSKNPENDMFYYHSSEERIVLSHALFLVMTASVKGKMGKEKFLLLLRQYQEDMLAAWLTESPEFKDLCCLTLFPQLSGEHSISAQTRMLSDLSPFVLWQEVMAVICQMTWQTKFSMIWTSIITR